MASSKLNIFNSLPQHASDSEDETTIKNAKNKVRHEKQEQRRHDDKGHGHGHTAPRDPNQKEDVARQKGGNPNKKVTAEPHPQDRQSGTGSQAYGGKPKKSGTGKGNWGNYKEDRRADEGEEGEEGAAVQEEEKPEGLTLAEYRASKNLASSQPQVNEAKSKITSDQLMKEVGKATLLKTKIQQEIDDKKVGKKKGKLDVNHHAGNNSEHSELLNFRTGFVEKEYRERGAGGDEPRRFGGNRREKVEGEAQPQAGEATGEKAPVEGQTTEATAPVEGEAQAQAQTQAQPQEGQSQGQGQGQRYGQGQGQDRRRNDQGYTKGGRGGYKGGDHKGGDHKGGDRKPYGGRQGNASKPNPEDESAFPKLG